MSAVAQAPLRPPAEVMRLARLGAFHPTRLSFIPTLLREFRNGRWEFARTRWEMNARGVGTAVYQARRPAGGEVFSLIAFGHELPPEQRTDRVIAEAWDATFALMEGAPGAADLDRLRANMPRQEAGRCGPRELVLSRANKSVRVFRRLVDDLRAGRTPDRALLATTGYLMRTTAVYGNGKFGLADRDPILRPALRAPFRAELLTVWLIRAFTLDWAEHIGGGKIPPDLRRALGVGNSTGLGMAPFLINHPMLLHRWMLARETALARVRAATMRSDQRDEFIRALQAARRNAEAWTTADARQARRIAELQTDLARATAFAESNAMTDWNAVWRWGERELTMEGQEALLAALLEPHGELVDDLTAEMDADEASHFHLNGEATVATTRTRVERAYDWALRDDCAPDDSNFWHASAEKLEPRLGRRTPSTRPEWELPLATASMAREFYHKLSERPAGERLGDFLARFPEHRTAARRTMLAEQFPYGELRENLTAADLIPVDMLRCKLSFFGAERFDPKSDKWLRINLFADAPLPCCFAAAPPPECAECPHREAR